MKKTIFLFIGLAWLTTILPVAATTYNWTGASATSQHWSDTSNWSPTGKPANGDSINFGVNLSNHFSPTNDLSGLTLNQIAFIGVITNYTLTGNAFTLSGGIYATNVVGTTIISNDITLGSGGVTMVVSNGENLELCGQISGSGNLTKLGAGTITYQYSSYNINTGTTYIYAGLVQLNVGGVEAFEGPLVIATGSGTAATVRYLQADEIYEGVPITINDAGVLDLNGFVDVLGPSLTFNEGGTIQTETGILDLYPGTTVTYNAGIFSSATISGNLDVSATTCTFAASSSGLFTGDLVISAAVSDSATIHKTGNGFLLLNSANTFSGLMSVEGGALVVNNPQALGTSASGTVVTNDASLYLETSGNIAAEPLVLASTAIGALSVYDSTNIWGGPITLIGNQSIYVETGSVLSISNAISGTGNLTETGGGVLEFTGNQRNTYTGTTYVNQGTLILSNTVGNGYAIPGALSVNTNGVVDDLASYQIDSRLDNVSLNEFSQFNVSPGVNEFIGSLTLQGATINSLGTLFLGGNLITVISDTNVTPAIAGNISLLSVGPTTITNVGNVFLFPTLSISADIAGATGVGLIVSGPGALYLTGANSFGGNIQVISGNLALGNSQSISSTNSGVSVDVTSSLEMEGNVNVGPVPLNLSGSIFNFGTNSWAGNVTLTGTTPWIELFNPTDKLTFSGIISGTGGWTEWGPGTVWFSGPASNPYSGETFVEQGTLMFNAGGIHAYGGPLVIGDGSGNDSPTVRLAQFEELNQSQPLTIDDGTLDLNNFYDYSPTNVTMNDDAVIETENGTLYVQSNTVIAVTDFNSSAEIEGNLNLETNCTLDSLNQGADLFVSAAINGTGNLITGGTAYTILESSNSYSGLTEVAGGALWVQNPHALGATNNSVIVSNNATLLLYLDGGITNKTLVLNGQGLVLAPGELPIGNLFDESGYTNYWAGPITVNSNSLIGLGNISTALHLSGPISGPGGIEVTNSGPKNLSLYLDGAPANTYSGATIVDAGALLLLNKSTTFTAIPGPCFVSGTMRQLFFNQQMYTQPLTIYDGGLFDLNGFPAYCAAFNGTPGAAVTLTGGAEFLPDFNSLSGQTCTFNGLISGTGYILHNGSGMLTLSNTNTYPITTNVAGTIQINGRQPLCAVTVNNGATLSGIGQVGNVVCNGAISPGAGSAPGYGAGTLTVSNLTMTAIASFKADLFGPAPGSYDQLVILGTNNLGNAALTLNPAFINPVHLGDTMMLVSNTTAGPLAGSFAGVTGGSPINTSGYQFIPSYTAGSGNDFTLTDTGIPAGALPGQIIGGNGNQVIDYDECDELDFTITNTGPVAMTGVSAVLSSTTPFVVVTQPYSTYPNIAAGAAGTNLDWFEVSTLPQFSGGTTINLQLTVTSSDGTFVIPFTVATEASIDGGGTCGSCLATLTNDITGSDLVETGEIKPNGVTSAYGTPKSWPGNYFGSYHYKVFTFTNTLATDAAVTVLVNAGCDVEAVAYVPAFDPSNISTNYAGDAGYYTANGAASFSFDAPAGSPFQIVVNEYTVNAGCSQYTLQLDGLPCPPPTLYIQPASTNTVQLTWPTWAGGFNLENASVVTGPGWVGNTNQPVVTQGLFSVTNGTASTNLFFRLHKP